MVPLLAHQARKELAEAPAATAEAAAAATPENHRVRVPRFRPSPDRLSGDGERLGVAYRLASGEVVYVPDGSAPVAVPPRSKE
jgi:hypothetical protein